MSSVSALLVRFAHVGGMAILLGGALFVWNAFRTGGVGYDSIRFATHYEWVFWGTMAVMLVTGVGNMGELGAPGPTTRWGSVLTVKLAVVAIFVVVSFVRTLVIYTTRRRGASAIDETRLSQFYLVTWVLVGLIVALAEVLAHG
ncbi:CopD family protein [Haloferax sp. DFSO52]|uniref:CopD family protein n=1 Tax=Haloferax sp. DFSO52 TaxID=3388505 RepID=UPI003A84ABE6